MQCLRLAPQQHVGEQANELAIVRHGRNGDILHGRGRRRWRAGKGHRQSRQHAVIHDGAEPLGARPALQDLGAQRLVRLDRRERQAMRRGRVQRFFLRATARSMLRGWTDTPNFASMRRASALARILPSPASCCSMKAITSGLSLCAPFGPR